MSAPFTTGPVEQWPDEWPYEPSAWCPKCQRWIGLWYVVPDEAPNEMIPCPNCCGDLVIALRPVSRRGFDVPGPEPLYGPAPPMPELD